MYGKLITIGNSQGMIFPSTLVKQYDLKDVLKIIPEYGDPCTF